MRILAVITLITLVLARDATAGPTYVIKEDSGVIRFTSRKPASGTSYQIFTGKDAAFNVIRGSKGYRGKLFKNVYDEIIKEASSLRGVDAALVKAVIHTESGFNPHAISPKGARGLMQLMPGTARDLGVTNSLDPKQNIHGGTRYLSELMARYPGNLRKVLAAYNAGPGAVEQFGGVPPYAETIEYIKRVMELLRRYK